MTVQSGTTSLSILAAGLVLLPATGCRTRLEPRRERVAFFVGRIDRASPDGRIPYNRVEAVLSREVFDGGAVVVETRTEAAPSPSMPPLSNRIRLTRRPGSLVYDAGDSEKVWSGHVTFHDAGLRAWTYALHHASSGDHVGEGAVSEEGLWTSRTTGGARPMRIAEAFRSVSREEYLQELGALRPRKGAE